MNGEEDYEELADEAEDQYDDSQDVTDGQVEQYETGTFSVAKGRSDLYTWFWRIVQLGSPRFGGKEVLGEEALKLSKVGNLNTEEIGKHLVSVRDNLRLANLGQTFHHEIFGDFWRTEAMTIIATSMSRKGWLIEQSISQKKVRARAKSSTPFEKSRIFGRKKRSQQEGERQ